jgi:hypothetical protein
MGVLEIRKKNLSVFVGPIKNLELKHIRKYDVRG